MSGLPLVVFLVDTPAWHMRNARFAGRVSFIPVGASGDYPDVLRDMRGRSGAYVIRDRGKVAYVGRAEDDLYKAATRHFQGWQRSPRARRSRPATAHDPGVTYERATSSIALVPTPAQQAYVRQRELIDELSPRDNVHFNPGGG